MDELKRLTKQIDDLTRRVIWLEDLVSKVAALVEPAEVARIRRSRKLHRHIDGSEGALPPDFERIFETKIPARTLEQRARRQINATNVANDSTAENDNKTKEEDKKNKEDLPLCKNGCGRVETGVPGGPKRGDAVCFEKRHVFEIV